MVHSFGYENAMKGPNDRIGAQMRVEQQFLRGNSGSRTTDTQWRHKSKKSEILGRCGKQNMLRPYLKNWDCDLIFSRAVKPIASLGVRSLCSGWRIALSWPISWKIRQCFQRYPYIHGGFYNFLLQDISLKDYLGLMHISIRLTDSHWPFAKIEQIHKMTKMLSLRPISSSHSKPRARSRTMCLKCFVLEQSVFKTKHLRCLEGLFSR